MRKIFTPKNSDKDPEDSLRVQELNTQARDTAVKYFTSTPDPKQLIETKQLGIINDGTTVSVVIKVKGALYKVDLTAL